MAEQQENTSSESSKAKKLPVKTLIILAVVLLAEVGTVVLVYKLAGGPAEAHADEEATKKLLMMEQEVEELVVADKFPNKRSGRTMVYDTEIYIVVKRKFQEKVQELMERKSAEMTADVREIISSSEPSHLNEPTLATLRSRIKATLDERIGRDEQENKPIVERVIITKLIPFAADL